MNKSESKYFNTAVKMDEALLSLLEKKEFAYITIREICEAAGVNRSTFYLHYENTSDLLREATQYILDRFLSYFPVDVQTISERFLESDLKDLVYISPKYLTPYLTFIKDNRRVFKTAVKEVGSLGFDKVYEKMFVHIFDPILTRFDFPEETKAYTMKFYLSGITAIVMEWLENNCTDSIDTITGVIMQCVVGKLYANE